MRWVYLVVLAAKLLASTLGSAAEISVVAGGGVSPAMDALITDFKNSSGNEIKIDYVSGGVLSSKIASNEPYDVGLIPEEQIPALSAMGKLDTASRSNIAKVGLALFLLKSAQRPDVSTSDALRDTLLNAKSVTFQDPAGGGTIGIVVARLLGELGIAESMKAKTTLNKTRADTIKLVKAGEVQYGIVLESDLVGEDAVQLAGQLPDELHLSNLYVAFLLKSAHEPTAAKAFINYISTPEAGKIIQSKGFQAQH